MSDYGITYFEGTIYKITYFLDKADTLVTGKGSLLSPVI